MFDSTVIEQVDTLPSNTLEGQMAILSNLTSNLSDSIQNFVNQGTEHFPDSVVQEKVYLLKEIENVSEELRHSTSTSDVMFRILDNIKQIGVRQNDMYETMTELKSEIQSLKRSLASSSDAGESSDESSDEEKVVGYALRHKDDKKFTGWASPKDKISDSKEIIGKVIKSTTNGKRTRKWKKAKK